MASNSGGLSGATGSGLLDCPLADSSSEVSIAPENASVFLILRGEVRVGYCGAFAEEDVAVDEGWDIEDLNRLLWVVRGGGVSTARDRGVVLIRVPFRV